MAGADCTLGVTFFVLPATAGGMKFNLSWQQVAALACLCASGVALVLAHAVPFQDVAKVAGGLVVGLLGFDKAIVKAGDS